MQDWEQRLDYLEQNNDSLNVQNHVLAVALKALLRALPQDVAQDSIESIQAAFEDEISELEYSHPNQADLFQDIAYGFFRDKS